MNVAVALAFFSACLAVSYAAPGLREVDWTGMLENAKEMRELAPRKYTPLISIVYADVLPDNRPVGDRIADRLRADIRSAVYFTDTLIAAIEAQSLTLAQVTRMVGDVVRVVYDTPRNMANDLAQLSPEAEDQVRKQLNLAFVESDAYGKEIVEQLRQLR